LSNKVNPVLIVGLNVQRYHSASLFSDQDRICMQQNNSFKPCFAEFDGSDLRAELAGAAKQKSQAQQSNAAWLRKRCATAL